jgi:hypothetical protein
LPPALGLPPVGPREAVHQDEPRHGRHGGDDDPVALRIDAVQQPVLAQRTSLLDGPTITWRDTSRYGREWSLGMVRYPAARRGIYDGLSISAVLAVLVFLTTVVTVGVLALLLVAIGARGRRRQPDHQFSGAVAGASVGGVLAVMITVIFLIVNNVWFHIVSQQHDKRVAVASSGWSSMRAYLNVTQLRGGIVLLVMLGLVGALLGLLGGALFGRRNSAVSPADSA